MTLAAGTMPSRQRGFAGKFARLNWAIITVLCAIAAIGVVMHFSVSDGSWGGMPLQHALRFMGLLVVALALAMLDPRVWLVVAYPIYGLTLLLLVAVELFGAVRGGAQRWIEIGPMVFQPSEMMKIAIVLALARWYQGLDPRDADKWWSILPPAIMIVIPTALILNQPDLKGLLVAASGVGVMFLAGLKWLYIVPSGIIGVVGAVYAYFFVLHDYQRGRINTFLDPSSDPLGAGYHVLQSKIAIGAAGVAGHGYLQGPQSQGDFLPEKHTDFIFTMIVEEFGLIGGFVVLGLWLALLALIMTVAVRARTLFAKLAAGGIAVTIAFYVFCNTAMVAGLIPVVGVPLPLLSYGGSSMLTMMLGIAIVLSIHLHRDSSVGSRGLLW